MKYYVRGRKANDQKGRIFQMGDAHLSKEIAEIEADKARSSGWILVGVTTAPLQSGPV